MSVLKHIILSSALIVLSFGNNILFSQEIYNYDSLKVIRIYEEATKKYKGNDFEEAIKIAEKSLQISTISEAYDIMGDIMLLLGLSHSAAGRPEHGILYIIRATVAYEKVSAPEIVNAFETAGDLFVNMKMYAKASEYYIRALNKLPDFPELTYNPVLIEKKADALSISKNYTEAEEGYKDLLTWAEKNKNMDTYLRSLYKLSELYLKQNYYQKNIEINHKLFNHFEAQNDSASMALLSNNIGYTHQLEGNYRKASEYFLNAIKPGENILDDPDRKSFLFTNLGICYQNLNEHDNSLKYLRQALEIRKSQKNHSELASLQNITALVYLSRKDLYNAGIFSSSSIESAKLTENKALLQECYLTYSKILKLGNDNIRALAYYELYLNLRDSLLVEQRLTEQQLAQKTLELEKTEKELRLILADEELKELELRNLQIEAEKRGKEIELLRRDRELEQSEKERILQSVELTREKHASEIRQKEIEALEQDKEIRELLLKQKETEEKERIKEIRLLEIEKERQELVIEKEIEARKRITWMLMLFALIIVFVISGFFIVRNKNQVLAKQKTEIEEKNNVLEQKNEEILTQNEQIIQQKELIEEKNKSITDSIQYARRIQSAVLPPANFLDGVFADYFLFFKPKDIVSGDFYWAAKKNDKYLVAAADCTGHGVPGAFMSMLGVTFLNEIVSRNEELTSSLILGKLCNEVINSLKQRGIEGETKDGMDIALLVYDKKNLNLQFSGANNPMYLLRDGNLDIFPADKKPIGISDRQTGSFTMHHIDLKKDDIIYIFSDGFADQFGGPYGKKFKYNRFRDTLKSIQQMSMKEQKEELSNLFDMWRSNIDQIDDVLIIGLRV